MTTMLRTFYAAFLAILLGGYGESTHFAGSYVTSRTDTLRFEDMPVAEKRLGLERKG